MNINDNTFFNGDNHAMKYVGHTRGLTLPKGSTMSLNDNNPLNEYYHVEINIVLCYYGVSPNGYLKDSHYDGNHELDYLLLCNEDFQGFQWINKTSLICLTITYM